MNAYPMFNDQEWVVVLEVGGEAIQLSPARAVELWGLLERAIEELAKEAGSLP